MARVQGVEERGAPMMVRLFYRLAKRKIGHVPEGMKIRAHDPVLLRKTAWMDLYTEAKGAVPSRLRRLAMLKTAMLAGCPF